MRLNNKTLWLIASVGLCSFQSQASEFDQYLQQKNIINESFKIEDKKQLNEMLAVLTAEDSKTLPIQIDHNLLIEQFKLTANKTKIKGSITTSDFTQFEQEMGEKEVKKLIQQNIQNNCAIFFEHHYQIKNAYVIEFELRSEAKTYQIELTQKDCGLK